MIRGHHLAVGDWEPYFQPSIDKAALWICIINLSLEYQMAFVLRRIGGTSGKPLQTNFTTKAIARGNFARIYVELKLQESFLPNMVIQENEHKIE